MTDITYNGTSLTSMFYNGVEVFSKTVATTLGIFYGGYVTIITRINANGALVGSETNVGTARRQLAGAGL